LIGAARVAVVLSFVGIIASGCAAAKSTTTTTTSSSPSSSKPGRGVDVLVSETSVSTLHHAHLKPKIPAAGPKQLANATKADVIDGIFVLPTDHCRPVGAATLSGLKTQETFSLPLRDQPEAQSAYCLATFGSGDSDFSRAGSFSAELDQGGSWVRADRLEGATPDKMAFHMFTLWADEVGRLQRLDEVKIPLVLLGSFAGASAFAFIDDDGIATKGKPSVDVIIQRPPLKRWRVQGGAFLISAPNTQQQEAGLSSCTHTWMTLPLEKGNGTANSALVAIETETGARALRVNVSSIWLDSQPHARITTRLQWQGEEDDSINLARLRNPNVHPPRMQPIDRGD
jgi:hypothetical protein